MSTMAMTTSLFGLPSSWIVYCMALASIIETIIFINLYVSILCHINNCEDKPECIPGGLNMDTPVATVITFFCIALSGVRFVFALVALIGQYMETIKTLAMFLWFAFVGMVANIAAGILGMEYYWTEPMAVSTIAIAALHMVYLALGIYIFKMESKNTFHDVPRATVAPGHVPYAAPLQATINVIPTAPNPQVTPVQQRPYNPFMPPAPDGPQPPPSYAESSSSGVNTRFPPFFRTDDTFDKGKQ